MLLIFLFIYLYFCYYNYKVDALIADIIELLSDSNREEEKVIVFSQWVEVILL